MKIKNILLALTITLVLILVWVLLIRPILNPPLPAEDFEILFRTTDPVYDKSCPYVTVVITNNGDDTLEFGEDWELCQNILGAWVTVPRENYVVQSILHILPSGASWAQKCYLSILGERKNGDYRIIKTINGEKYTAQFSIGKSPITAQSPYGYAPVGTIGYDASVAEAEGAVLLEDGKLRTGKNTFLAFLEATQCQNRDAGIRLYYYNDESRDARDITVIDIERQGYGHGRYRVTTWDQGEYASLQLQVYASSSMERADHFREKMEALVMRRYYSYLVIDGNTIYLSNTSTYTGHRDDLCLLYDVDETIHDKLLVDTNDETVFTTSAWSADGSLRAWFTNEGAMDGRFYLGHYNTDGIETFGTTLSVDAAVPSSAFRIVDLIFDRDNRLLAVFSDGNSYHFQFHDMDGTITDTSSSLYPYHLTEDGNIVFWQPRDTD